MKPIRISPLLFRQIHKWVGLILGLQFVLWTLSGSVMALLDSEKVGGHSAAAMHGPTAPWPTAMVAPSLVVGSVPVNGLTLHRIGARAVYEVQRTGPAMLFDAVTGDRITVDSRLATLIATEMVKAPVRAISRLPKANLESRDHDGPMWRVDFADTENSAAYVSAETGRLLVVRGDTWRTWDFFWMLHNMDYISRKSFNHPLIIFVAFGTLWLSLTGFYLLFKSFRRREFRWVLGNRRPVSQPTMR